MLPQGWKEDITSRTWPKSIHAQKHANTTSRWWSKCSSTLPRPTTTGTLQKLFKLPCAILVPTMHF